MTNPSGDRNTILLSGFGGGEGSEKMACHHFPDPPINSSSQIVSPVTLVISHYLYTFLCGYVTIEIFLSIHIVTFLYKYLDLVTLFFN